MKYFKNYLVFVFAYSLTVQLMYGQKTEWSVDSFYQKLPHHTLNKQFDEGTWMNLDVSPDGQWIVFDLFGDIYKMPITGGTATVLSAGPSFDLQPRFSPDGKFISFTSDKNGGDNIWYMKADGSDKKAITDEKFRLLNNAIWTKDGKYIIARKHFTATRSLGAGEMWMYHISGGNGYQMTTKRTDQKDVGEPNLDPSGKFLYWSEDVTPGNHFEYNKDPNGTIYAIKKLNIETGEIETLISGNGGACRPQISPDGKLMAYVRRVRNHSTLFLYNMNTGETWPVYDGLSKDQQETWAIFGVYPNFNWLPDNQHIVLWANGKIWKLNTLDGKASNIPFSVNAEYQLVDALYFKQVAQEDKFKVKMIRQARFSPDEKIVAFNAVGHIWLKELPNGKAYRVTDDTHFEYQPSFSNDGKKIIYTTWEDENLGSIRVFDLKKKKSTLITKEPGYYHDPVFNNDNSKIAYRKGGGNNMLGYSYGLNKGIYIADANGENATLISKSGEQATFSNDGEHLYYLINQGLNKKLMRCDLLGKNHQVLYTSTYANELIISPNEEWIAFKELYEVYIAPFAKTGKSQDISSKNKSIQIKKVSQFAGDNLHWSPNSKYLHFNLGEQLYKVDINEVFDAQKDWKPDSNNAISIGLELKSNTNSTKYLLTNARILTMDKDNTIIEMGNIYVNGNTIEKVEHINRKAYPSGYTVIDLKGKTVMPGLIDVHAHLWYSSNGISPQQQWSYMANLAYGVTTTHDPSASSQMVFSQSEMVKVGMMQGPRIFSTGTILYGADGDFKAVINSLDDARKHLFRMKSYGAFSVKSYNQPRRNQRQQIILAAHELQMHVYPEGGSTFYHNMNQILDGHTGIEHSIPIGLAYQDVQSIWASSGVGYTPTLIVGYGGIWGENYWYQKTNVWENEKLLKWTPRSVVDTRSRRRTKYPDEEFNHFTNAKACYDIMKAGTKVQLGAHGQLQGLGAHWELWMLTQGGFSNLEAIKAATQWGADYLGMGDELGSIEVGKLADLIVIDGKPDENIYDSDKLVYTILNGRIYKSDSLNEVFTGNYKPIPFWFERFKTANSFNWHQGLTGGCSCFGTH